MSFEKITEEFEKGIVSYPLSDLMIEAVEWNEHALYKGVFLKHIIKGPDTNGSLSCHFVKVNPGCTINTHAHAGKLEIHEIIGGGGLCVIGDKAIQYKAGSIALIPADISHKVIAGNNGIFILATFSPALI